MSDSLVVIGTENAFFQAPVLIVVAVMMMVVFRRCIFPALLSSVLSFRYESSFWASIEVKVVVVMVVMRELLSF